MLVHITWFFIAIIQFFIILVLLFIRYKKNRKSNDIDVFKTADISMSDLMENIHLAKTLYKELSRKCHPDRFVNSEKFETAEKIFQEISLNERNYKELLRLKDESNEKLFNN